MSRDTKTGGETLTLFGEEPAPSGRTGPPDPAAGTSEIWAASGEIERASRLARTAIQQTVEDARKAVEEMLGQLQAAAAAARAAAAEGSAELTDAVHNSAETLRRIEGRSETVKTGLAEMTTALEAKRVTTEALIERTDRTSGEVLRQMVGVAQSVKTTVILVTAGVGLIAGLIGAGIGAWAATRGSAPQVTVQSAAEAAENPTGR